jgi:hypothetical protein
MDRDFYFRFGRLALRLLLHEPNDLLVRRKVDVRPRQASQIRQSATRVVRADNQSLPITFSGLYQLRNLFRRENVFISFAPILDEPYRCARISCDDSLVNRSFECSLQHALHSEIDRGRRPAFGFKLFSVLENVLTCDRFQALICDWPDAVQEIRHDLPVTGQGRVRNRALLICQPLIKPFGNRRIIDSLPVTRARVSLMTFLICSSVALPRFARSSASSNPSPIIRAFLRSVSFVDFFRRRPLASR